MIRHLFLLTLVSLLSSPVFAAGTCLSFDLAGKTAGDGWKEIRLNFPDGLPGETARMVTVISLEADGTRWEGAFRCGQADGDSFSCFSDEGRGWFRLSREKGMPELLLASPLRVGDAEDPDPATVRPLSGDKIPGMGCRKTQGPRGPHGNR
jgi:hypothetical protein